MWSKLHPQDAQGHSHLSLLPWQLWENKKDPGSVTVLPQHAGQEFSEEWESPLSSQPVMKDKDGDGAASS